VFVGICENKPAQDPIDCTGFRTLLGVAFAVEVLFSEIPTDGYGMGGKQIWQEKLVA